MNAMTHISTHAHQRMSHLPVAQVVYIICFYNYYTLLCTDVAHQDHLYKLMHGVHMRHIKAS